MKKTRRLGLALLLTTALWSCESRMNRPHELTVEGCVSRDNGNFALTTNSGIKY